MVWLPSPLANLTLLEDVFEHKIRKKGKNASQNKPLRLSFTSIPRVKKILQQAIKWKALLESGKVANKAEIARNEGLSRARVTQIMSLLLLAPEIQQHILNIPKSHNRPIITERALRRITQIDNTKDQSRAFELLFESHK
jgi:hypothetical protein